MFGKKKTTLFLAQQYSQMEDFDRKVAVKLFSLGVLDIFLLSDSGSAGTDFQSPRQSYMCQFRPIGKYGIIMQFKGRLNRIRSHDMCPDRFKKVEFELLQFDKKVKVKGETTDTQNTRTKFLNYYRFLFVPTIRNEAFTDLHEFEQSRLKVLDFDNFICMFCGEVNEIGKDTCTNCKREKTDNVYYYFHISNIKDVEAIKPNRDIYKQKQFQERKKLK